MPVMNFTPTPQLWNQIAMILAWYWDDENDAGPRDVVNAIVVINLVLPGDLPTSELTADQWRLLFDALNSYRESEPNSWNDDLEAFYKIVHDNYWRLTLPEGEKPPETKR